jgi:DNA-binding response OmpR family regulator
VKKILVVEDDISIAELERDYLEIEGFSVEIEQTGSSALRKAESEDFDLIILDVMLPEIDGFEICKTLRKKLDIPILLVTAKKEDIDKIRGLGLGADDYITKPFSPGELIARIKSHLTRYKRLKGEQPEDGIFEVRGLSIDEISRRVFVRSKEVFLTAKEFDILLLLAKNPDRVFRKENIFNIIWGEETYGDVSTVTVHIRKIREKIEEDANNPKYIETVWGVGYRFAV